MNWNVGIGVSDGGVLDCERSGSGSGSELGSNGAFGAKIVCIIEI